MMCNNCGKEINQCIDCEVDFEPDDKPVCVSANVKTIHIHRMCFDAVPAKPI